MAFHWPAGFFRPTKAKAALTLAIILFLLFFISHPESASREGLFEEPGLLSLWKQLFLYLYVFLLLPLLASYAWIAIAQPALQAALSLPTNAMDSPLFFFSLWPALSVLLASLALYWYFLACLAVHVLGKITRPRA